MEGEVKEVRLSLPPVKPHLRIRRIPSPGAQQCTGLMGGTGKLQSISEGEQSANCPAWPPEEESILHAAAAHKACEE